MRNSSTKRLMPAALCGAALLVAALPVRAEETSSSRQSKAEAARLRAEIPSLPHLVRATPNIYLIRIESVETPEPVRARVPAEAEAMDRVTATVQETLKGKRAKKLTLNVKQRHLGAMEASLLGGVLAGDPDALHRSPEFFSPQRFLSPRNPMFGGPRFEKDKLYLVFTDLTAERLLGGPYGYQPVTSPKAFWVETVKRLVANPDSEHAVEMGFAEFIRQHRSAFLMVIGDCLGTEVTLSEPLWGEPVRRKEIDPMHIFPESAEECAGALDEKRGLLGLIEAEPWLYQHRRGYPNQSFIEIRDGVLDFSDLGLDIGFPDDGRVSVADLTERLSAGAGR